MNFVRVGGPMHSPLTSAGWSGRIRYLCFYFWKLFIFVCGFYEETCALLASELMGNLSNSDSSLAIWTT